VKRPSTRADIGTRAAVERGINLANRVARFDIVSPPRGSARLLTDVVSILRAHLLNRYDERTIRSLLSQYEPGPGFRWVKLIPDDDALAIGLLNTIATGMRCDGVVLLERVAGEGAASMLSSRRRGGRKAAIEKQKRSAAWQRQCVAKARRLLKAGRERRELAGILAPQFGKSARQVREVLKKAEVR
jgi:hypothetical protein